MNDSVLEEVFIVGSRYGKLADAIAPLYEKVTPIEKKDIMQAVGSDLVYLKPVPNIHDEYAMAVFNENKKQIGFVWMYQAPTLRYWLEKNNKKHIKAHITDVNPIANVLVAIPEKPIDVPMIPRRSHNFDERWASNIPDMLISFSDSTLELSLEILNEDLEDSTEWNKKLELSIKNLLEDIPYDLSAYRHNLFMEVFNKMRNSDIKEVREQSNYLLKTLIYRGSKEHVRWWSEKWLPNYFRDAAEGDLLGMFEAAHWTLENVELVLEEAPEHLFYLYKVNRDRFVNRLYYYALPLEAYIRLLTLLAVREMMLEKAEGTEVIDPSTPLSKEVLAQAIEDVQDYFWGYSSNAVLFCVCKDKYNYPDNTSLFERETRELKYHKRMAYLCADGTISNAFKNNSYMKYNVDKWEEKGAKDRALILRDEFIKAVERAKKNMAVLRKTA